MHEIPAGRSEPAHLHHDVRYALQTSTPDAIAQVEAESLALQWFDPAEAARRMAEPGADRALRRIVAADGLERRAGRWP